MFCCRFLPLMTSFQLNLNRWAPRITSIFFLLAKSLNPPALTSASRTVVGTSSGFGPGLRTSPLIIYFLLSTAVTVHVHLRPPQDFLLLECFLDIPAQLSGVLLDAIISPIRLIEIRPSGRTMNRAGEPRVSPYVDHELILGSDHVLVVVR